MRPFFLPVDVAMLNGNTERPGIYQWTILVMDSTLPAKGTAHRASRGTEKVGFSIFCGQTVLNMFWPIRWTRPQSTSSARAGCGLPSAVPWLPPSKSKSSSCQAFSQVKFTPAPKGDATTLICKKPPNGWVDVTFRAASLMTC